MSGDPGPRTLVIAMVGLPASGKSTVAAKIAQCLESEGAAVRVFNNGDVRRSMLGGRESSDPFFYSGDNAQGVALREKIARVNMERAGQYLQGGGQVAILDATNVSRARRALIARAMAGHRVLFLECVNTDPELVAASIGRKAQLPEFAHLSRAEAEECFRARIRYYERIYEPLDGEDEVIVLDSVDNRILRERVGARLPFFGVLRDLLVSEWVRNLYLVRHGETFFNLEKRIGGDPDLTPRGLAQAEALARHFRDVPLNWIFVSTRRRTRQMAQALCRGREECSIVPLAELDEIDAGVCDAMTYDQIAREMPQVHARRQHDKFNTVYPGGEGYAALARRVARGVNKALYLSGNAQHIMIVGHQAVNRTVLSRFLFRRQEDVPFIHIPQDRYFHIVSTQTRKVFELVQFMS
uniref:6-phosphofructokinase n=1 Tax=Fundidesulfovibrio putealis TaxID=270496 RepID=A0A7C3W8S8_9BACT